MKNLIQNGFAMLIAILCTSTMQDASAQQIKASLSYDQTISTFFEVAPNEMNRLYEFEKVGLRSVTESRSTSTIVDQNGDIMTTIVIRSTNEGEPWMNKTSSIVIDKVGVKTFDASGKTLVNEPYSADQLRDYNALKQKVAIDGTGGLPEFRPLSPSDLTTMQGQGYSVQTLTDGTIKARKGNTEFNYNNANKFYSNAMFDAQNKPLEETLFFFKDVNGRNLPSTKVERSYSKSSRGVCISQVTTTTYSNYTRTDAPATPR
jgi:hypothetical protein